ncbi:MAG: zinc-binding protein [Firmicutes bacterium]|jgi:CxxC-x17-CxxC domain-containing protein|nr:zinc-binding protein [Bacillota bacterium]
MSFEEKILTCKDCGNDFVFTVGEQEFFAEKGFTNLPGRCPECRQARKRMSSRNSGFQRSEREMFTVECSACGNEAQVPFRPRGDRPVYCAECFRNQASSY